MTDRIAVYLDEDVDPSLARDLRQRGHDVHSTGEEELLGSSDCQQLDHARSLGWAILTHNRNDFLELAKVYAKEGTSHAGILYVPQVPYRMLLQRMVRFLDCHTRAGVENVFLWIP